jgi:hypothetical protein
MLKWLKDLFMPKKMTKEQIQECFDDAKLIFASQGKWLIEDVNSLWDYWTLDLSSTSVRISNASGWTFDELQAISNAFDTKNVNVLHDGCGTCGFGSTITVGVIIRD